MRRARIELACNTHLRCVIKTRFAATRDASMARCARIRSGITLARAVTKN
jgi:hypothetical protein